MSGVPTRPGDVPDDVTLAELADRYSREVLALLEHRHGINPLTRLELATDALTALVFGTALVQRTEAGRWSLAADALAAGAGHELTATAMGLDLDQLRFGLAGWAAEQRRHGLIDEQRRELVMRLVREVPS